MILNDPQWASMILNDPQWPSMILNDTQWYPVRYAVMDIDIPISMPKGAWENETTGRGSACQCGDIENFNQKEDFSKPKATQKT